MVLDLLKISSLECLASGSMDTTIRLWDINTGKARKVLEGHAKGVTSLAYSQEYRFLVSAGFDYDAVVWNPYVEKLILRLHGHNSSLVGVEIIPDTPQIITADKEGFIKVWDIRNFSCMQTFNGENVTSIQAFKAIYDHKCLVSGGRGFTVFDYEKLENPELTEDHPVFSAIYNPTSNTFITAAGSLVKVWDAKNGKLSRVYRGITTTDLTAICLDDRERKFITGDHSGHIQVYDYLNGALMKTFEYYDATKSAHLGEVSRLVYANQHKCVISASWDKTICIHDEMEADRGVLLRKMSGGHGSDITALAYSENLSLIASSDSDGFLNIWDFEFATLEDSCIGHTSGLTALAFLDPYPALLAADNNGNICLWAMRPSSKKYKCLVNFTNTSAFNRNLACPVVCMAVNCVYNKECECVSSSDGANKDKEEEEKEETKKVCQGTCGRYIIAYDLFTGDEKGEIKHWSLMTALNTLQSLFKFAPLYKRHACDFPRRNLKWNATDFVETMKKTPEYLKLKSTSRSAPFFFQDGTPYVSASEVRLVKWWRGHHDTINSIQCIAEPPSLLTASFDR
jgi:WD40 repeat protein